MDAVVLGRIGYDLYSDEPGKPLAEVRRFSRYLGGSSANIAVGLARLGAQVGMIAAVGEDALSSFLLNFLGHEHVDTAHVQRIAGYLPSLCLTEVTPPDHFPQVFYRHDPADAMLTVSSSDLGYASSGRLFVTNGTSLCQSPSREGTYRAMERAREAGCRVVLDIDYRSMSWKSPEEAGLAIRLALPFVDVLIGNQTELELASGEKTLEAAVARLRQRGLPMLVSKLGDAGVRALAGGEEVFLPPYAVEVVSTIGAGDGFASGFLYGILKGLSLKESLHYGNAAAAIVVSRQSCSEAMPRLDEVKEMIARQRKGQPAA